MDLNIPQSSICLIEVGIKIIVFDINDNSKLLRHVALECEKINKDYGPDCLLSGETID